MATKRSALSARGKHQEKKGRHMPDKEINFSDIPELTSEQLLGARRVGRPRTGSAKQLIALRVAPNLLQRLKKLAKSKGLPYQRLMHEMLERAVKKG